MKVVVDITEPMSIKESILTLIDMKNPDYMRKRQILVLHKKTYNYWQGKNGRWYSYLPKTGIKPPKGKQIESIYKEKLDRKIIDHYFQEYETKEETSPAFLEVVLTKLGMLNHNDIEELISFLNRIFDKDGC